MATLAAPTSQEVIVAEALATVPPPKGVRLLRFYFDHDHTGDLAVRIVYGVSKKIPLTKARVRDLVTLSNTAAAVVEKLGLDRIPYVRLDDVR